MGSILLGTQYHHTACWQPSWQGLSSWQQMGSQQQCHPTYGQHPPGHSVPSHCLLAAILARDVFLATNGQSAAVAAQYIPSGQQYHPT